MSIVRISYLAQIGFLGTDASYIAFNAIAASIAEGSIAVICACAPSLRSCFRVYFKNNVSTRTGTTAGRKTRTSEKTRKPSMGTNFHSSAASYEMDDTQMVKKPEEVTFDTSATRDKGVRYDETVESVDPFGDADVEARIPREIYGRQPLRSQPTSYCTNTDDTDDWDAATARPRPSAR